MLEGHGCVHAHGDDTDDSTDAEQRVHPLQRKPTLLHDTELRPLTCHRKHSIWKTHI